MDNSGPAAGKLLVSAPFLDDIFKRSVIFLTENSEEGSVGFILNKPTDYKLHEVIDDFPEFDAKIYLGGPVQQGSLNFMHKCPQLQESGVEICNGIYWNGNFELLKIHIKNHSVRPEDFKFFLGYAGWSPDQLEEEIKLNSWYINNSTQENVFDTDSPRMWSKVLKSMGKQYSVIASFPEDASVN